MPDHRFCDPGPRREDLRDLPITGPAAGWVRAREALLTEVDVLRPDLDWDLRRVVLSVLGQAALLVPLLPSADAPGQAEAIAEVAALAEQVAALRTRLGG